LFFYGIVDFGHEAVTKRTARSVRRRLINGLLHDVSQLLRQPGRLTPRIIFQQKNPSIHIIQGKVMKNDGGNMPGLCGPMLAGNSGGKRQEMIPTTIYEFVS